eukprot:COSAG06_NODE_16748_length_977_cov_1.022624_1_plen_182_part_00
MAQPVRCCTGSNVQTTRPSKVRPSLHCLGRGGRRRYLSISRHMGAQRADRAAGDRRSDDMCTNLLSVELSFASSLADAWPLASCGKLWQAAECLADRLPGVAIRLSSEARARAAQGECQGLRTHGRWTGMTAQGIQGIQNDVISFCRRSISRALGHGVGLRMLSLQAPSSLARLFSLSAND